MVALCNGCASAGTVLTVRCWRCGGDQARVWHPYALCEPCVDVVSPKEIAWMEDPTREPGKATWEMTPLGRPGGVA